MLFLDLLLLTLSNQLDIYRFGTLHILYKARIKTYINQGVCLPSSLGHNYSL